MQRVQTQTLSALHPKLEAAELKDLSGSRRYNLCDVVNCIWVLNLIPFLMFSFLFYLVKVPDLAPEVHPQRSWNFKLPRKWRVQIDLLYNNTFTSEVLMAVDIAGSWRIDDICTFWCTLI